MPQWRAKKIDDQLVQELLPITGSAIVARVLAAGGVRDVGMAQSYLSPALSDLHDPFLLSSMDKVVKRIAEAKDRGERVLVCGDYDVDGISSTALLLKVLRAAGIASEGYLPTRQQDGYGFRAAGVESASAMGAKLIITVDCGIAANAPVAMARERGIDVIVTDHHEPKQELPAALAILNPKVPGDAYPFKELAGAGVAIKLAHALWKSGIYPERFAPLFEFAALGTVADVAPLNEENRVIVKFGLQALQHTANLGLQALKTVAGLKPEQAIEAYHIGFVMAPRMNAAGRMESAANVLRLLLSEDRQQSLEIATQLNKLNQQRQTIESTIVQSACSSIDALPSAGRPAFLVVAGEDWHVGVIGIVASRLVERYYRPCVVFSLHDSVAKGSARSIPGFHLFNALKSCEDLFHEFGGHRLAAGLTISSAAIETFKLRMNAASLPLLTAELLTPTIEYICQPQLSDLNLELTRILAQCEPFGLGNPKPLFCLRRLRSAQAPRRVGADGKHLKASLTDGRTTIQAIGFSLGDQESLLGPAQEVDVIGAIGINEWNGRESVQLVIKDIHPHSKS